ncbi:hypothetical protein [Alteromonas lipolytica]|uniref:HTH araC/xylS-type domain-containing protein n=2 Tax=Alteromonas lipolytica TaxID=1856405 RepID=A0A1E8FF32_9ALTE|nr:hypothetical protein [Alteromonas lipolytica]OFI34509.1 hypothetical protein BFC17_17905 [Alteromonas lipolytica]
MSTQQMIPIWSAGILTLLWFTLLFRINRNTSATRRFPGFLLAMLCWPVVVMGELWQLGGGASVLLSALSVLGIPLVLWGAYRNLMAMIWRRPALLRWPFWAGLITLTGLLVAQFFLLQDDWQQWAGFAPTGDPIRNWSVYAGGLLTSFLLLYIGIVLIEQVQQYHYELPMQVVDTEMYQLKGIAGSAGFMVAMAFFMVVLVAGVAFGLLPFYQWLAWFHLGIALTLLILLSQFSRAQKVSPSPFDHHALSNAPKMSEARAQAILKRAEAAVISQKAYKELGLKLQTFAERADLSASDICLALLAIKKTHFRGFIYQFRMKYAKQVLLGSDAKLDSVTKRLKLGANGTASQTFLRYLESRR